MAKEFEHHAMRAWNGENDPLLPQKYLGGVGTIAGHELAASPSSLTSPGEGISRQERSVKAVSDFLCVELPEDGPVRWIQL